MDLTTRTPFEQLKKTLLVREGISYFLDNIMSRDFPNDVDLQKACGMYGKNAIYKLKYRKWVFNLSIWGQNINSYDIIGPTILRVHPNL